MRGREGSVHKCERGKRKKEATKSLKQTNIDFLSALHCNCTDLGHLFGVQDVNEPQEPLCAQCVFRLRLIPERLHSSCLLKQPLLDS